MSFGLCKRGKPPYIENGVRFGPRPNSCRMDRWVDYPAFYPVFRIDESFSKAGVDNESVKTGFEKAKRSAPAYIFERKLEMDHSSSGKRDRKAAVRKPKDQGILIGSLLIIFWEGNKIC